MRTSHPAGICRRPATLPSRSPSVAISLPPPPGRAGPPTSAPGRRWPNTARRRCRRRAPGRDPAGRIRLGPALLVVLGTLKPAGTPGLRAPLTCSAFSWTEIATVLGRSPNARKMLASRARHRARRPCRRRCLPANVRSSTPSSPPPAAGNFDALFALLDPDVVLRADAARCGHGFARGGPRRSRRRRRVLRTGAGGQPALVDGVIGRRVGARRPAEGGVGAGDRGWPHRPHGHGGGPASLDELDLVLFEG